MEIAEARQIVGNLSGSIWAFSALYYAAEKGILEQLGEPRTLFYVSEHSGVPITLVERILDILVALNLARREGDTIVADKGLLPLVTKPAKTFFLASLKSNYLECRDFVDSARKPTVELGWSFTEPEILQSQGWVSAALIDPVFREVVPRLGDLASRLQSPSARFLDVGAGIGAISIAACRVLSNLHAIGLEPQDAPLAEARRTIAAAGLADRIQLRKQRVEDITDKEAFDLAFFPQAFVSDDVVKRGLQNIWRALRPGGWLWVATLCLPGMGLQATISRLCDTLMGGGARIPSHVQAMMSDAGFTSLSTFDSSAAATVKCIAGQRPT
jgi:predicted O-methyltransferase YrrM